MALIDTRPEARARSAPTRRKPRFRLLGALEDLGKGRVGLLYLHGSGGNESKEIAPRRGR